MQKTTCWLVIGVTPALTWVQHYSLLHIDSFLMKMQTHSCVHNQKETKVLLHWFYSPGSFDSPVTCSGTYTSAAEHEQLTICGSLKLWLVLFFSIYCSCQCLKYCFKFLPAQKNKCKKIKKSILKQIYHGALLKLLEYSYILLFVNVGTYMMYFTFCSLCIIHSVIKPLKPQVQNTFLLLCDRDMGAMEIIRQCFTTQGSE